MAPRLHRGRRAAYPYPGRRRRQRQLRARGSPATARAVSWTPRRAALTPNACTSRPRTCSASPSSSRTCARTWGERIELLHDVHEAHRQRASDVAAQARRRIQAVFYRRPVSPEQIGYFRTCARRRRPAVAMGELFNSPHEFTGLIAERLIDFIRVHISQIGGAHPGAQARRVSRMVRRAHGLARAGRHVSCRPLGEHRARRELLQLRHSGRPHLARLRAGGLSRLPALSKWILLPQRAPGWGLEIDEELAAKYDVDSRYDEPFDYHWERPAAATARLSALEGSGR